MNSRITVRWLIVAVVLGVGILLHLKFSPKHETGPIRVLPGLKAADIQSLQVLPKGRPAIHAERATNGVWRLTEPACAAQSALIEYLLDALQQLEATTYIPVQDLNKMTNADSQFGLDPPQASLLLDQRKFHVLIGDRTALGDQVFVQVAAAGGVYVVDAALLKLVPQASTNWRERALVDWSRLQFDRVVVTNAGKMLELQRHPTNQLWRMVLPLPTRADSKWVEESLQRLQGLRARDFVSDDPKPDLESFGLETPELTLAFFQGTNTEMLLHFGKSPTNSAGLAYARRADQSSIVTVPQEAFQPWLASASREFRDFLDHHLVSLAQVPDSIEIRALDNFTLYQQTNRTWQVQPGNFPADLQLLQAFVSHLVNLRFPDIEKDIVLEKDLPTYGLKPPARQYILRIADTNALEEATNRTMAQLDFGMLDDKVYARTRGEDFVYTVDPKDPNFTQLPTASWQLRHRQIWNFTTNDVARITIRDRGKTCEMVRSGPASWQLAPGSQGIINTFGTEEAAYQLGELTAANWVARGDAERDRYGFKPDGHQVTVELTDGRKLSVEFGSVAPSLIPFAVTLIDGEPWIFEFPPVVYYKNVLPFLTIPTSAP